MSSHLYLFNYTYIYIFIFIAPQTVPELIVTPLSPISLHVEWSGINVNMVNGTITQYQVMWRRSHGESNYVQALPKEARQYTITGNEYKYYNHLSTNMT